MSRDPIYDDLDPLYRGIWGTSLHHGLWLKGHENCQEALANLAHLVASELPGKGTFADIGCGYGTFARALVENGKRRILACTLSRTQAARIARHPSIEVLCGDWLDQHLPENSLDAAIAIESLSYFPSFDEALQHTASALKPGGRLITADWFSECGDRLLLRHLATTGNLPRWRSPGSLISSAKKAGLIPLHSRDLSREAAPTWSFFFGKALTLPFREPGLIPRLLTETLKNPSLLWSFPLLRLAYQSGDLRYHCLTFQK
jgi:tocopherol O-methyltransferase